MDVAHLRGITSRSRRSFQASLVHERPLEGIIESTDGNRPEFSVFGILCDYLSV